MMEETRRAEEPWAHPTAKDEGWEDLDIEDADDPLMVAEYVNEIFVYMKKLEVSSRVTLRSLGLVYAGCTRDRHGTVSSLHRGGGGAPCSRRHSHHVE